MSTTVGAIRDILRNEKPDEEGVVRVTTSEIADKVGKSVGIINQTTWLMQKNGEVETVKDKGIISGFRVIALAPTEPDRGRKPKAKTMKTSNGHTNGNGHKPEPIHKIASGIRTPLLESYIDAKHRWESFREKFGEYVQGEFQENPALEEALTLHEAYDRLAARYSDLSAKYQEEHRELDSLRAMQRMKQVSEAAGVMVQHGD